jgi:hypothetical protein
MDFKSITIGNKSVVKVTIGNITIYPKDFFTVEPIGSDFDWDGVYLTVDNNSHSIQIKVTSIVGGVATGVTMSITNNGIGMSGGGYTDGPNLGERIYSYFIPVNSTYDDRHSEIMFRQYGTNRTIYIQVWQDM